METYEDLAAFRTLLRSVLDELNDSAHVLLYDQPSRGVWWERLEQLAGDAETLANWLRYIKDRA